MLDQLLGPTFVQAFTGSSQGQQATKLLESRGLSKDQVTKVIAEGLPAAASALKGQTKGPPGQAELGLFDLLGGHPGQAFLIGTVTSLVKGEGVVDAMQDGMFSIVGSHVSEVIASRVGMDRQTAGWVGAALTPFVVSFVQEKLGNSPEVGKQRGAPPSPAEIQKIIEAKRQKALANPTAAGSKATLLEQEAKVQRVLAEKAAKAGGAAAMKPNVVKSGMGQPPPKKK